MAHTMRQMRMHLATAVRCPGWKMLNGPDCMCVSIQLCTEIVRYAEMLWYVTGWIVLCVVFPRRHSFPSSIGWLE